MYCYYWSLSHTICDNLFDTSIYLHCSFFAVFDVYYDWDEGGWPHDQKPPAAEAVNKPNRVRVPVGQTQVHGRRGTWEATLAEEMCFLMLKEIQGSSYFSPSFCVWSTAKPKLQILKISPERTRPNRPNTQHLPRIHKWIQNPIHRQLWFYSIVFLSSVSCFKNWTKSSHINHGIMAPLNWQAYFLHYGILDLGEHWTIGGHK